MITIKKFLVTCLLLLACQSQASTIEIVWPFGQGGTHDALTRTIVDNANKIQTRYKFVTIYQSGAGGALAVNNINLGRVPRIISHTSSFWIRPLLFEEGKYDVNDFIPLSYICTENALALVSSKYKDLDELKNRKLSIGVIPGSITNLAATALFKNDPNINFIPYKTARNAAIDLVGRHIDLSMDFYAEVVGNTSINVIGVTGKRSINNVRTFNSHGMKDLQKVTNSNFLIIKKDSFSDEEFQFLSKTFKQAAESQEVVQKCRDLHATPVTDSKINEKMLIEFKLEEDFWKQYIQTNIK